MIAVIDYGAGNIKSVLNALSDIGAEFKVTNDHADILNAERIIFPGVGAATYASEKLHKLKLFDLLRQTKIPLLGICLGMQMLTSRSEEGNTDCLGILPVSTLKFNGSKLKVPHMGWNKVSVSRRSKLFTGITGDTHFYFAHSYYVPITEFMSGSCSYDVSFSAAVEKDNYYGVQFHPEKSGPAGIQLLKNFIELC